MRPSILLTLLLSLALLGCPPQLRPGGVSVDDDDAVDDDDVTDDDDTDDDDDGPWDDDDDEPWDDDESETDPAECPDVGALIAGGEARDGDGVAKEVFGAVEEITLSGWLQNPCDEVIEFETPSSCLFDEWSLWSASGQAVGLGCDGAITPWTIEAGGFLFEETVVGTLEPDFYIWEAWFGSQGIEVPFDVVAP